MKFQTFIIKRSNFFIGGKPIPKKPKSDDITGVKPTDIIALENDDGETLTVSKETWKRIELFAEILSAVDMTINQDKLNEILGGRS